MAENYGFEGLTGVEILSRIEEMVPPKYDDSGLFKAAHAAFKVESDAAKVEEMEYEIQLFELSPGTRTSLDAVTKPRFMPQFVYTNGMCWPDVSQFTDSQKQYYLKRGKETANHFLKCIYCDFVWEHLGNQEYARLAIDSYEIVASASFKNEEFHRTVDCVVRCLELSAQLKDKSLIGRSVDLIQTFAKEFVAINQVNRLRALITALAINQACHEKVNFDLLVDLSDIGIKDSEFSVSTCTSFYELKIELFKLMKQHDKIGIVQQEKAEHYVREADRNASNPMNVSHFLNCAIQHYHKIDGAYGKSYKQEIESLQVRLKAANIASYSQMQQFTMQVPIPVDEREEFLAHCREKSVQEILEMLATSNDLMLSEAEARAFAEESLASTPLFALMNHGALRDGNIAATQSSHEEKIVNEARGQALRHCDLTLTSFILPLFVMLIKEKQLSAEVISDFLGKSNLISESRLKIIAVGLDRFFANDFVSSAHLLVFQIEGILRDTLAKLGRPTSRIDRKGNYQERTLDDILRDTTLQIGLSGEFCYFLRNTLSDRLGKNYRNDIGHALTLYDDFTFPQNVILICQLLRLAIFRLKEQSQ